MIFAAVERGEKMDDYISRQALLDKFEPWLKVKDYNDGELNMLKAILYEIRFMRSAQPERIKGRWEQDGHHIKCDQCGEWMCDRDREGWNIPKNYCPNCGAKMEVTT